MQDFTGVPAIVDLAAMRDAMEELGGDPALINPLVPVELVIDHSIQVDVFGEPRAFQRNAELEFERNRERYAFLRWGQSRVRQLLGRSAEHRDLPPGQPRVPRERGARARRAGVPGHAGRHRLAHDDGQRARRARLGRRRHRGRGGDARPAGVDADPGGRRLPADRRAAGGRDGDRPRSDRHADAAPAPRGQQVRRVLRPGAGEPAAGRPRDDRQHVAGVRRDVRDLPGRRRDAALPARSPAARPSRSSSSRRTAARRACSTSRARRSRCSPTRSSSTWRPSSRAWPGRAGRRTASRSATRRATSARSCARSSAARPTRAGTRPTDLTFPASDPPSSKAEGVSPKPHARAPGRRRAGGPRARRRRRPRPRGGGDRGDHELHEHVEPVGHARRRAAGPQGGRGGTDAAAVGEDEPRARARRSSPSTSSARG